MTIRKNTPRSQETSPKLTFAEDLSCTPSEGVGGAHHRYGYTENYLNEFTSGCTLFFN